MPHLFTYGTLMFPEVWRIVLGDLIVGKEFATTPAQFPGYQIFRVRNAVYPGIIKSNLPPSTLPPVPGLLYHNLDAESLARLDAFEGPEYIRQTITVTTASAREVEAQAYVVPPESRHLLTDENWTPEEFAARGDLARFVARYAGFHRLDQPPT